MYCAALRLVLQRLLSGPDPDFDLTALVNRKLMESYSLDGERLALLREVHGLLAGLRAGTYPAHELAWLVTSAWNRGVHQQRFGRTKVRGGTVVAKDHRFRN